MTVEHFVAFCPNLFIIGLILTQFVRLFMKKTTVALSLALAITGGAAWAGKYTLVTPHTPHLQQGWSSANPQDVNRVDATGGVAFLTITVDKQSPGPSPISNDGIKVNCAGTNVSVRPGSADKCTLEKGQYVTWADDGQKPNHGATGMVEIN
ncbi:hypothetical protein AYM02_08890 [Coxiella burnetii]|uniref:Hypothetical membrane associated protein n=1 Tax=Coxiella burnetii (strain RSA 493 / Nine Mile phase I) TaxID=227377 RepID=Q83CI1_COXBU|nr:hypothetical protein [Coxiella burnetii]NP_820133.1 membrane-associated protein [Coxiella burnetii RSA 493]AAO90647.1 hypothetical membrane associated protein [Coxiella burnetii RSA 493]ABX78263.1 hypothetical protein COXBURSA331_A1281 [Coxiella burnetii RSA 331]AML49404.1 hypothetical protein AUR58_09700 [Coxiella burnetii]AML55326.1 hypothetical protein AYM38_08780 [Coxiella burnetii]ARI65940.1 hypothetical protein B7L74_05835 [Coxiella burnetii]